MFIIHLILFFRNKILQQGLIPSIGEQLSGYYEDTKIPAIFATNSDNKGDWFDSTYDDDFWKIDTTHLENIWYYDKNFEDQSINYHILTFQKIPKEAISLIYRGTGETTF